MLLTTIAILATTVASAEPPESATTTAACRVLRRQKFDTLSRELGVPQLRKIEAALLAKTTAADRERLKTATAQFRANPGDPNNDNAAFPSIGSRVVESLNRKIAGATFTPAEALPSWRYAAKADKGNTTISFMSGSQEVNYSPTVFGDIDDGAFSGTYGIGVTLVHDWATDKSVVRLAIKNQPSGPGAYKYWTLEDYVAQVAEPCNESTASNIGGKADGEPSEPKAVPSRGEFSHAKAKSAGREKPAE